MHQVERPPRTAFLVPMIIAIVGSRKFPDEAAVRAYVRTLPSTYKVISGGAPGVDQWAEDEAKKCGIWLRRYPAQWTRPDGSYNRGAGYARNAEMVKAA